MKNEDGVVIMFILNFEDLAQLITKSASRSLHQRLSQSWRGGGCHQGWWGRWEGSAASLGLSPSHGFLGSSWGAEGYTHGKAGSCIVGLNPAECPGAEVCVSAQPQGLIQD